MFETLWIVLTLLQAPAPLPLTVGLPSEIAADTLPTDIVTARVTAPAPLDIPATVVAQAPSAPPPATAKPPAPPPRIVRGKSELSYVSTGGTAETQTIGTSAELLVTPTNWRVETKIAYLRNRVNDEVRARRLNGQFRSSRKIGDAAEVFGRANYLRNTFAGIRHSWDAAVGVTTILFQNTPQRLAVDSGFGYLTEDRTQGLGRDLASLDVGVRYAWEFSRRNRFTNDAAVKTDIERTSDWRLIHVAAVQAGLNSILSLRVSHELNYRNEPVPGFTRADTVASASIVATF